MKLRMERLELSRMSSPDSKSGVSTNYTTSACSYIYIIIFLDKKVKLKN